MLMNVVLLLLFYRFLVFLQQETYIYNQKENTP